MNFATAFEDDNDIQPGGRLSTTHLRKWDFFNMIQLAKLKQCTREDK